MEKAEFDQATAAIVPAAEPPKKRTKVAILGFVKHYEQAPFNDPSWEIWGLNELYQFIPRWDRWFEVHDRALYENDRQRTSEHIAKLKAMTCPIYMHRHWDDIPTSVPYPLEEMARLFPNPCPNALPYFTNSITLMILLAIAEGFEEMNIYGVDMSHSSEYSVQRASCEWAIGIAQGRGIKVYLPNESELLKTNFIYGYQVQQELSFAKKLAASQTDMERNISNLDSQLAQATEARAQYRGALQMVQHIKTNWVQAMDELKRLESNKIIPPG